MNKKLEKEWGKLGIALMAQSWQEIRNYLRNNNKLRK